MNIRKISDRISYIGTNDRTTALFESLWPLPYGVSYNSYLAEGTEKTAIIDGVEAARAPRQIEAVRELLGGREPDYLIVNHMEPDHSGDFNALRNAFPGMTIVGNPITLSMIKEYYGITENTLTVKDGDTLSLGTGATLRFVTIPMVHWPETMVTVFEEEHTAFSGDAFGCFGALNGAVIDSDMDTDRYFPEMVRYYSNIVGRYGAFVQKAIARLNALATDMPVSTLCPTHGPVWRERAGEVIGLYDRLSRYEPLDNGVTIVYGSMYGNTARMAEAAAEALAAGGVREIAVHNAAVSHPSFMIADIFRHRGLVIAAPTYSDGLFPPVNSLLKALDVRNMCHRDTLLIAGHTWSQRALDIMTELTARISDSDPESGRISFRRAPTPADFELVRKDASAMAARLMAR